MRVGIACLVFLVGLGVIAGDAALDGYRFAGDARISRSAEAAAAARIRAIISTRELESRIAAALEIGDVDTATLYARAAAQAEMSLKRTVKKAVRDATEQPAGPNNRHAFARADGAAPIASSIAADIALNGAGRDIMEQARLASAGDADNIYVLGLAALQAGAAGGDFENAPLGLSILKLGGSYGVLTQDFVRLIAASISDSLDFAGLESDLAARPPANETEALAIGAQHVRSRSQGRIWIVAEAIGRLGRAAGPAAAIRLLPYIETPDDLADIVSLAELLGPQTRAAIELGETRSAADLRLDIGPGEFIAARGGIFLIWALMLVVVAAAPRIKIGRIMRFDD